MTDFKPCKLFFPFRNQKGFTLIELILVMVLIGIAAVMVTPFVGQVLSNLLELREINQRQNQAVLALERFTRDVQDETNIIDHSDFPLKCVIDGDLWEIVLEEGTLKLDGQPLARYLAAESEFHKGDNIGNTGLCMYKLTLAIQMPDPDADPLQRSTFVIRGCP
jgi:prepilin-type N-terminal cleavage/methylation domain-containing protein